MQYFDLLSLAALPGRGHEEGNVLRNVRDKDCPQAPA